MMDNKLYLKKINFKEAVSFIPDYEFALLYFISEMKLEKVKGSLKIPYEELIEAYFFRKDGQLHLYRNETGELEGTISSDTVLKRVSEPGEFSETEKIEVLEVSVLEKKYELANHFQKQGYGKYLVVKEYLSKDKDGQNFVAYTRMAAIQEVKG